MIASASIARRSLMDRLLLDGMEWTDRHPGLMFAGMAVTIVLACLLEQVMP